MWVTALSSTSPPPKLGSADKPAGPRDTFAPAPYRDPDVRKAILERWPAIAVPQPPSSPQDPAALADHVYMGQELTEVLETFVTPVSVARSLSQQVGGTADEVVPNGKTRLDSTTGLWVVDHDGRFPGGGPILEVDTPPLVAATEPVIGQAMATLQQVGDPEPTVGGGHIHVDGAPFLASPRLLSRFLQTYLHVEPALLAAFRHPMRTHAARGFCEMEHPEDIKQALAALGECSKDALPDAVLNLIERFDLHREMALNIRSLCGVKSGNKKSKGTIEIRLFDTPGSPEMMARQHHVLRLILAYALSDRPLPSLEAEPISDPQAMMDYLT